MEVGHLRSVKKRSGNRNTYGVDPGRLVRRMREEGSEAAREPGPIRNRVHISECMSPLQTTNDEIRRRFLQEERRREARRLANLPVRSIDLMLAELEEMHLAGRKRVPETFEPRLEALAGNLPAEYRPELRSRITIVHLMDRLYAIQDRLLSRRQGLRVHGPVTDRVVDDGLLSRAS